MTIQNDSAAEQRCVDCGHNELGNVAGTQERRCVKLIDGHKACGCKCSFSEAASEGVPSGNRAIAVDIATKCGVMDLPHGAIRKLSLLNFIEKALNDKDLVRSDSPSAVAIATEALRAIPQSRDTQALRTRLSIALEQIQVKPVDEVARKAAEKIVRLSLSLVDCSPSTEVIAEIIANELSGRAGSTPLTDRAEQNTSGKMRPNTPPANVERSLLPTQEQGFKDKVFAAIGSGLNSYRCTHTVELADPESGSFLVDVLTPEGDKDVTRGKDELESLIDYVCGEVLDVFRASDASKEAAQWLASVVWLNYHNRTDLDPVQQKHLELAMKAGAPFSQHQETK